MDRVVFSLLCLDSWYLSPAVSVWCCEMCLKEVGRTVSSWGPQTAEVGSQVPSVPGSPLMFLSEAYSQISKPAHAAFTPTVEDSGISYILWFSQDSRLSSPCLTSDLHNLKLYSTVSSAIVLECLVCH